MMQTRATLFLQYYDRLLLLKLGLPFRQCDLGLRYRVIKITCFYLEVECSIPKWS